MPPDRESCERVGGWALQARALGTWSPAHTHHTTLAASTGVGILRKLRFGATLKKDAPGAYRLDLTEARFYSPPPLHLRPLHLSTILTSTSPPSSPPPLHHPHLHLSQVQEFSLLCVLAQYKFEPENSAPHPSPRLFHVHTYTTPPFLPLTLPSSRTGAICDIRLWPDRSHHRPIRRTHTI